MLFFVLVISTALNACISHKNTQFGKGYVRPADNGQPIDNNIPTPEQPGEGEGAIPESPNQTNAPQDIEAFLQAYVEPQLPLNDNPQKSAFSGKIVFIRLTPVPDNRNAAQIVPGPAQLPVVTRIIDDEDNIGSIEFPTTEGEFEHIDLPTTNTAILNVVTQFAESITGVAGAPSHFDVRIPIALAQGKITEMNIVVSPVPPERFIAASSKDAANGAVIEIAYAYRGPEGPRTKRLAIDFAAGITIIDSNGDAIFDPGDQSGPDRNFDGIIDDAPLPITALGRPPDLTMIEGFVIGRPIGALRIEPKVLGILPAEVVVDPRTSIVDSSGFELHLPEVKLGDYVLVQGFGTPGDRILALTIVVFPMRIEAPPGSPPSGGGAYFPY
jgi:hypothetical protein